MIIQHPDGHHEVCALPPELLRWVRMLLRSVRRFGAVVRAHCPTPAATAPSPCPCDGGAC